MLFGSPLPLSLHHPLPQKKKKKQKKRCQNWTPSGKTFWIRACHNHHASVVVIFTTSCALKHYSNVTSLIFDISILLNPFHNMPFVQLKSTQYRGSNMSAHVLLNLLNELGKIYKIQSLPSILSHFCNELNKCNNTGA